MRIVEFFEGDDARLSMTRLLCFMSFFPASWVAITKPGEGTLGLYLGAYVLSYVGGKSADVFMKRAGTQQKKARRNVGGD